MEQGSERTELRVRSLRFQFPHRRREHLQQVRALVVHRGRVSIPTRLARTNPELLHATTVTERPASPLQNVSPRGSGSPLVTRTRPGPFQSKVAVRGDNRHGLRRGRCNVQGIAKDCVKLLALLPSDDRNLAWY